MYPLSIFVLFSTPLFLQFRGFPIAPTATSAGELPASHARSVFVRSAVARDGRWDHLIKSTNQSFATSTPRKIQRKGPASGQGCRGCGETRHRIFHFFRGICSFAIFIDDHRNDHDSLSFYIPISAVPTSTVTIPFLSFFFLFFFQLLLPLPTARRSCSTIIYIPIRDLS